MENARMMAQKAELAGSTVKEVSSVLNAFTYTMDLCREKNLKTITAPGFTPKERKQLADSCREAGLILLDEPLRSKPSKIDISVTWADTGIADTGTLMLSSDSEEIRLATMLADIHVALLPLSRIAPDTTAIESQLDTILKQDAPSYTAFITGPSRTADIERVLAIGVHGPVAHHLLLLKGE